MANNIHIPNPTKDLHPPRPSPCSPPSTVVPCPSSPTPSPVEGISHLPHRTASCLPIPRQVWTRYGGNSPYSGPPWEGCVEVWTPTDVNVKTKKTARDSITNVISPRGTKRSFVSFIPPVVCVWGDSSGWS